MVQLAFAYTFTNLFSRVTGSGRSTILTLNILISIKVQQCPAATLKQYIVSLSILSFYLENKKLFRQTDNTCFVSNETVWHEISHSTELVISLDG